MSVHLSRLIRLISLAMFAFLLFPPACGGQAPARLWRARASIWEPTGLDLDAWRLDWEGGREKEASEVPWWDSKWHYRLAVESPSLLYDRKDVPLSLYLNFPTLLRASQEARPYDKNNPQKICRGGVPSPPVLSFDPNSIRVVEFSDRRNKEVPSRCGLDAFRPASRGPKEYLTWFMPGQTKAGQKRKFHIYFDIKENGEKKAPDYPAEAVPPANLLKNPSFKEVEEGRPKHWNISPAELSGATFMSLAPSPFSPDRNAIKLEINEENISKLEKTTFTLSQRLDAESLAGNEIILSAKLFLKKGEGGCCISTSLRQYDEAEKKLLRATQHSFILARGQVVKLHEPGRVAPSAKSVVFDITVAPALLDYSGNISEAFIRSPEVYLTLYISEPSLRTAKEVPFPAGELYGFQEGAISTAPRNRALHLTGPQTLMFFTTPIYKYKGIRPEEPLHFHIQKGTIEARVRPDWDWDDGKEHSFFHFLDAWFAEVRVPYIYKLAGGTHPRLDCVKTSGNLFKVALRDSQGAEHKVEEKIEFKKGKWYHIAFTWDLEKGELALFIDGKKRGEVAEGKAWQVASFPEVIEFGNYYRKGGREEKGRSSWEGAIDELRISDVARYAKDFAPAKDQFTIDEHTRALFHFEENLKGVHFGGDRFIPTMTVFPKIYTGRFFLLEERDAQSRITAKKIKVKEPDAAQMARIYDENKPAIFGIRERMKKDYPDHTKIEYKFKSHKEQIVERRRYFRRPPEPPEFKFRINVAGDYAPLPRFIKIEAQRSDEIAGPAARAATEIGLISSATIDQSSVEALLAQILKEGMSEEEKARAIFQWAVEHIPWWHGISEHGKSVDDPAKFLNIYGSGICSQQSALLRDLFLGAGLTAGQVGISHHVPCEVYYTDDWHLFDMTYGAYPLERDNKTIASIRELMSDLWLADRMADEDYRSPLPNNDSRNWAYHYIFERRSRYTPPRRKYHSIKFALRQGESLTRYFYNRGEWTEGSKEEEMFWEFGNGDLIYEPECRGEPLGSPETGGGGTPPLRGAEEAVNMEASLGDFGPYLHPKNPEEPAYVIYKINSPYVIVGAKLTAALLRKTKAAGAAIFISTDGKDWQEIKGREKCRGEPPGSPIVSRRAGMEPRPYEVNFTEKVKQYYTYWIKFELNATESPDDVQISKIRLETTIQTHIPSLPSLALGENEITLSARLNSPIKVTYGWVERYKSPIQAQFRNSISWCPRGEDYRNEILLAQPGKTVEVKAYISLVQEIKEPPPVSITGLPRDWSVEPTRIFWIGEKTIFYSPGCVFSITPSRQAQYGIYPFVVSIGQGEMERDAHGQILLTPGFVSFEAEEAALSGNMEIGEDPEASQGKYILTSQSGETGYAETELAFPADGSYQIWGHFKGNGVYDGRVYVAIDGGKEYRVGRSGYQGVMNRERGGFWHWAKGGPVKISAGKRKAKVRGVGDGTHLDCLIFIKIDTSNENEERCIRKMLIHLFLNRKYRPWASEEAL